MTIRLTNTEFAPKRKPLDYRYHLVGNCTMLMRCISKSNDKTQRYLSARFRAFEDAVALLTRQAFGQKRISVGWVIIELHFRTKTHIDLSNAPKSLLDGMVKGGVLQDDKNIAVTVLPAVYGEVDKIELQLWAEPFSFNPAKPK